MRVLIQKVTQASVSIDKKTVGKIGQGILLFLGIEDSDGTEDIEWLSGKITRLRIFNDINGVMNVPIVDMGGDILVISQFTLHASTKKGNRPSYIRASKPDIAVPLYKRFIAQLENDLGKSVEKGEFGAYMEVSLVNDGPVTLMIDSKNKE